MMNPANIELSDGNKIPSLGFGTSSVIGNNLGDPGFEAIVTAIRVGYRFLDTAALYLNEDSVGLAIKHCIKEGLVKREELFICTKVWCTRHKRESVMKACKESLGKLGLDYVDLYLIHWPVAYEEDGDPINPLDQKTNQLRYSSTHFTETWRGMEDVKEAGLARSIGVSNFNHEMTDAIFAMPCKHAPVVNQVECHVYLSQIKLHEYSKSKKIILNAYCPLGSPHSCAKPGLPWVIEDPTVKELAEKHNKSPGQVLLRYLIQRQISAIPKSINPKRIAENFDVFDFELTKDDMSKLMDANRNLRYCTTTGGYDVKDHPLFPFHIEY